MSRTHDVTISAFDLDRLETDLDHLAQIADMRRKKIVALEHQLESWREVAGDLHAALAASAPGVFPGCGDSAIRSAALEAYARLKTSTLHAPDSTLSYEL